MKELIAGADSLLPLDLSTKAIENPKKRIFVAWNRAYLKVDDISVMNNWKRFVITRHRRIIQFTNKSSLPSLIWSNRMNIGCLGDHSQRSRKSCFHCWSKGTWPLGNSVLWRIFPSLAYTSNWYLESKILLLTSHIAKRSTYQHNLLYLKESDKDSVVTRTILIQLQGTTVVETSVIKKQNPKQA